MTYRCALNGGPADLQNIERDTLDNRITIPDPTEPDGHAVYVLKRNDRDEPALYGRAYHHAYRWARGSEDALLAELDSRRDSQNRQGRGISR